jgi:hypothetical protein
VSFGQVRIKVEAPPSRIGSPIKVAHPVQRQGERRLRRGPTGCDLDCPARMLDGVSRSVLKHEGTGEADLS